MRPLRLQVKGFTAFRDAQEIDFTDLDVFAISGPTGSGKSSLLDAITYALYGRVERVGDRVGQLLSQGQPRMAVTLEFEVGRDRYQLTRTTPAKGATKVQLMRRGQDGEWSQAGEGSDRVRDAERLIVEIIGLTYDGFTRSVLLPQGTFAEFLVGEAKKRREILIELLGLSLFRRMAERARAVGKETGDRAQWTNDMLDREYGDATPEVLKEARREAKEATSREQALGAAAGKVLAILERWRQNQRSVDELRACAEEASTEADEARRSAGDLQRLSSLVAAAEASVAECMAAAKAADGDLQEAGAALREAEAATGSAADLTEGSFLARSFRDALAAQREGQERIATALEASEALAAAKAVAERALGERAGEVEARQADVRDAEAALEEARHTDLVAAVSAGLKAGDPCPVCGVPLEKAPRWASGGLDRVSRALGLARAAGEAAHATLVQAQRAADRAARDVDANAADGLRLAADAAGLESRIAEQRAGLEDMLGSPLPEDPALEIDGRLSRLQSLDQAERLASAHAAESAQAVLRAEQERDRISSLIDRQRDRLGRDRQALFDRAARASGRDAAPVKLPPPPHAASPAALGRYASKLAEALSTFAGRLGRQLGQQAATEGDLLREATEHVGGLVEPEQTLEALARSLEAACRSSTEARVGAAQRAKDLAQRLDRRKKLSQEAQELQARALLFKQLAQELQADRLIAYLQAEALQVLAVAGSERLSNLSGGRYRLAFRDDEFFVLDTWNGDEERSVRTLSGGETFLASLALALALAEQVRSLSTTDRAKLDSLFLDEGFGTLDQETLGVVRDAIEQLGHDGRLVGVITHVRDLAEQFPRIEVEKSPRGSRLQVIPA